MTPVPLKTLIGLGLTLDEFSLIYRYKKPDKSFKAPSHIESLQSTPIQPHQELPGSAKPSLFSEPSSPLQGKGIVGSSRVQGTSELSERVEQTGGFFSEEKTDWGKHRARENIFDV